MKSVFIGIPAYTTVSTETEVTLKHFFRNTREVRLYEPYILHNQSCIPFARNMITDAFKESACDYLFFIDADIYIRNSKFYNAIDRLVRHNKPIIGGVYVCKNPPFPPACSTIKKNTQGASYERFDKMPNPLKVPYCATGFLLITREALEVCGHNPFNLRYWRKLEMKEYQMPEDYSFCELASDKGVQSWVDTQIELLHIGVYYYGLVDFYNLCEHTFKLKEGERLPATQATI